MIKKNNYRKMDISENSLNGVLSNISTCFLWKYTKQGRAYWDRVKMNLEEIHYRK